MDLYTRGTLYAIEWVCCLVLLLTLVTWPTRTAVPVALAVAAPLLVIAEWVVCARFMRRAMDAYLGRGEVSRRLIVAAAGITAATTVVVLVAASAFAEDPRDTGDGLPALLLALTPFLLAYSLLASLRIVALVQLTMLVAVSAGLAVLGGVTGVEVLVFVLTGALVIGWTTFTVRVSMWMLAVMWELHEARDVQARLAVAEERLRFGRDLHDVLGRNLAVIALKSELAVQLARRERPEAVDQMIEVQRIARESQREVRDVVRGYRAADLRVELEGARGVLDAAGIDCSLSPGDGELPREVQSALAWVVREATTNVLRHGDARRCAISVVRAAGTVVLTVENDGAGEEDTAGGVAGGGSGLAGLRERLSAVHGTLEAGRRRAGLFRLTARVPLDPLHPLDGRDPLAEGGERAGVRERERDPEASPTVPERPGPGPRSGCAAGPGGAGVGAVPDGAGRDGGVRDGGVPGGGDGRYGRSGGTGDPDGAHGADGPEDTDGPDGMAGTDTRPAVAPRRTGTDAAHDGEGTA
ncbi:sensor histidine kinase [Streptomyces sp. NPDC020965]|uniref:sensor histidine kinase n=1 Tax=Streptomyces sp. NPDC020965 TaxID=3365105 RepID=UPI0037B67CC5